MGVLKQKLPGEPNTGGIVIELLPLCQTDFKLLSTLKKDMRRYHIDAVEFFS